MKTFTTFKKMTALTIATIATIFVAAIGQASAIPYTGESTPPLPAPGFNAYTGTPSYGDEADFLKGKVSSEPNASYRDPLNDPCQAGTQMTLRVYVHNGASQYKNDNGNGPSVAKGTKVKVTLPTGEASTFKPSATISATNASSVTDGMTINCANGKKVTLNYVAGSASQWTYGVGDQKLSDTIVTTGAPIGTKTPNGDVWGCWDQRVWVTLKVVIKEVPAPEKPVYSCDALTVTKESNRTYKFVVSYTAKNGATFKNVAFNFGDGSSEVVTTQNNTTHTYAKDGTFTAKATVRFTVDGKEVTSTGPACEKKITVTPENCPIPGKEHLPKNDPACSEGCPVPGKEDLPKGHADCVSPPMPETGSGSVVAIVAGISALAAGAHYFIRRRSAN